MPDILIRGMKMPKSCAACPFNDHEEGFKACSLLMEYSAGNGRLDNCPLVELPPHGDLIDRDAFVKSECNSCDGSCENVECDCLKCEQTCRCDMIVDAMNAPVVIPASKGESE